MHGLTLVDIAGSALALPFENESFNSLLCSEVLEHTPEPLLALNEMYRVAKIGAHILLTVPFSEQLHEEPYDYYRFTKHSIVYLLEKSGWRVVRFYVRGGAWKELGYRLSSFLYSSIGAKPDQSGKFRTSWFMGPPVVLICMIIQISASLLDHVWNSPLSTIGYGVVAEKDPPTGEKLEAKRLKN